MYESSPRPPHVHPETARPPLDLLGCSSLTDVSALAEGCPRLRALNLSGCAQLADVSALGRCAGLETLSLLGCNRLQPRLLHSAFSDKVSMLSLSGIDEDVLANIVGRCDPKELTYITKY